MSQHKDIQNLRWHIASYQNNNIFLWIYMQPWRFVRFPHCSGPVVCWVHQSCPPYFLPLKINVIPNETASQLNSPDDRSTRLLLVVLVTFMWTTTLLSSREISSVPSSRLLKRRSPSGFHVRNWKLTDTVLWLARPGSCRKLVALKKTGKVWVSTQEKDRLRCQDRDSEREIPEKRDNTKLSINLQSDKSKAKLILWKWACMWSCLNILNAPAL